MLLLLPLPGELLLAWLHPFPVLLHVLHLLLCVVQ
jgi:hypothetical protein